MRTISPALKGLFPPSTGLLEPQNSLPHSTGLLEPQNSLPQTDAKT